MAKKKKSQGQADATELTRKQVRLNARDRARNRKVMLAVGVTLGAVVVVLLIGLIAELVIKPRSAVASVGDERITTSEYWKRLYLEENQLENRFLQLQQLEQQFGGQGVFTAQLSQIQATLSSPFALGVDVLDQMIQERLIEQEAAARGITVTDEEVEEALRAEIAASQGAVTEPQATSTAEAAATATEVAAAWTPTPTPTIDASQPLTAAEALELPTPAPQPTLPLLSAEGYAEGLDALGANLDEIAGLNVAEYRDLIRARLLSDKLAAEIGDEEVEATGEEVHARHILIREIAPPAAEGDAAAAPEGDAPETRTLEEAQALAEELVQRIRDGEDFAALAAEYSDDLSNAQQGGDLGWFGRGRMVAPFEEAAFSLAPGEVSDPVETQFGFHIIEVLERDDARPKDEATLEQERFQAFQEWLQQQLTSDQIERADNLTNKLPDDIADGAFFNAGLPPAQPAPIEIPAEPAVEEAPAEAP